LKVEYRQGLQAEEMLPPAVVRALVKARLFVVLHLHPSVLRAHGKVCFSLPRLDENVAPGDPGRGWGSRSTSDTT
jgi:hypothetical protein